MSSLVGNNLNPNSQTVLGHIEHDDNTFTAECPPEYRYNNDIRPRPTIWSIMRRTMPNQILVLMGAMKCIVRPVSAAPMHQNIPRNDSGFPNIVSSLQDISAILTLFAADTVEHKLSSPNSSLFVKMSSVWSIFGLIGVLRRYTKFAWGLSVAEAAGLDLAGAEVFTLRKTSKALSCENVGSDDDTIPKEWQDNSSSLLGQVNAPESVWIRPHMIVVGYSQCPMEGVKGFGEVFNFVIGSLFTLVDTIVPIIHLVRDNSASSNIRKIAIAMAFGLALVVGCLTPILISVFNTMDISRLCDVDVDRASGHLIRDGDGIITDPKTSTSTILWRKLGRPAAKRSGDISWLRLLCFFDALIILTFYVSNYALLSHANTWASYSWLYWQLLILLLRFILWSRKGTGWFERNPTVLYLVTGSLVTPLPTAVPDEVYEPGEGPRMDDSVVRFALSSASSKLNNGVHGSFPTFSSLIRLVNTAPADILYSKFIEIPNRALTHGSEFTVALLSGPFVEGLYLAQGLVLGRWPSHAIYLAAVFEQGRFIGLTTTQTTTADLSTLLGRGAKMKGVTYDSYLVENINSGVICGRFPEPHLTEHLQFREQLLLLRRSARANGPTHVDVHTKGFGRVQTKHFWRTKKTPEDALNFVREEINEARSKNHSSCRQFCQIFPYFATEHYSALPVESIITFIFKLGQILVVSPIRGTQTFFLDIFRREYRSMQREAPSWRN